MVVIAVILLNIPTTRRVTQAYPTVANVDGLKNYVRCDYVPIYGKHRKVALATRWVQRQNPVTDRLVVKMGYSDTGGLAPPRWNVSPHLHNRHHIC